MGQLNGKRGNSMKRKSFLSDCFQEDELDITEDQEGVMSVKGLVKYSAIWFKLTIKRNGCRSMESMKEEEAIRHKPVFTGTISMIDPKTGYVMLSEIKRRKMLEAGKEYKNKDIYASTKVSCDSTDPEDLRKEVMEKCNKLMMENRGQLQNALRFSMTPEHITLPYAAETYGNTFLAATYPNSKPDRNERRMRTMTKIAGWIGAEPICKLKVKDVLALLNSKKVTIENHELMIRFVEYLRNNEYVKSKNPFGSAGRRERSHEEEVKKALGTPGLGATIFYELVFLLEREAVSAVTVAIALMISGFSVPEVRSLTWGDIRFVKGVPDFVVVNLRRDQLMAAIHDFSRPVLPDIAIFLREAYKKFSETVEDLDNQPLLTDDICTKYLSEAVNNLLVRAGYHNRLNYPGRPSDENYVPITVLEKNYKRMLISNAGLDKDHDTFNFLCGNNLKSTTFTNYISHTSPEAMWRYYTILKSISVEKKLRKYSKNADKGIIKARPETTHEIVMISGKVVLEGTEKLRISCPHGVHGVIEATEYLPENNV